MSRFERIQEALATRIRKLRTERGSSQESFAAETGIDRSYYGRIERGDANPTLRNLVAIAEVLGVSLPELLEEPKSQRRK